MKTKNIVIGIAVLLLPVISFFGYYIYEFQRLEDRHIQLIEGEVDNIRLVNVGEGGRTYIANILNQISDCNPDVIALDFFFNTYDSRSDASIRLYLLIEQGNTWQSAISLLGIRGVFSVCQMPRPSRLLLVVRCIFKDNHKRMLAIGAIVGKAVSTK